MTAIRWQKSSYSGGNTQGACIELASSRDAVRDSKNPDGPVLKCDATALVRAVRDGLVVRRGW